MAIKFNSLYFGKYRIKPVIIFCFLLILNLSILQETLTFKKNIHTQILLLCVCSNLTDDICRHTSQFYH